ncbi:MAG: hypothetical protein GXY14_00930, partial [Spirochaetes bacterium]|nr:hypothetical protein [Spirochaetota bacterium]
SVATSTITSCGDGFSGVRYGSEGRGIKIKADDDAGTLSGVSVEQCTVESSEAGVFVSGNTDDVIIKRCKFASNGYGVVAYDVQASSTLKIAVQSSLFLANSIGFGFHVAHGNGFELYNNTFIDNTLCGIGVSAHSGIAKIKNNILYSSSVVRQFESIALTSAEINYNCYTSGAGFIRYNSTDYNDLAAWDDLGFDLNSTTDSPDLDLNFRPGADAVCRNGGVLIPGVATDYYGDSFKNPPTIGAVEY